VIKSEEIGREEARQSAHVPQSSTPTPTPTPTARAPRDENGNVPVFNNALVSELADFLSAHTPQAQHDVRWGEREELRLQVTTYLCDRLPPRELVTSARAVVLRDGCVLVVRDPGGRHIIPGGRCEPDETLEQTVQREALEETGWAVVVLGLLGVLRFRHRSPKPAGYPYPYPEFYRPSIVPLRPASMPRRKSATATSSARSSSLSRPCGT
jgi:hypothetical protein